MITLHSFVRHRDSKGRFSKTGVREIVERVMSGKRVIAETRKSDAVYYSRRANVTDSERSHEKGLLWRAFQKMNLRGDNLRNATLIELTVRGKDRRDKEHRFKLSLHVAKDTKPSRAEKYLMGALIERLRSRGYRTSYDLSVAVFDREGNMKRQKRGGYQSSKTRSSKLNPLHNITITAKVFK